MMKLYEKGELKSEELIDLMGYVNTIITHITDGNKSEERLVNVMGGTVIESESERLVRVGKEEGISIGVSKFWLTESASLTKTQQYWK